MSRLKISRLRKRGADTNQNIFYLVIAVIVVAAAAFGFDQALKAMNRTEARTVATAISNQTRALYAGVGDLPTINNAAIVSADVLPGNALDGTNTGIILPNSGTATISNASSSPRDFQVIYSWAAGRGQGICNALAAGATPGAVGTGTRIESGPLGMDYTVTDNACASTGLTVVYHR